MRKKWNHAAMLFLCLTLAVLLACPAYAAFSDVPENHWAAADIQYVVERGLFNGTSPTTFAPNSNMNRAMLATVLYRYAGSPAVSSSTPYVDVAAGVAAGEWYSDAVTWAYQNGIFTEATLGWKQLLPSESVRRAEFAIMLYHYSKTLGKADCNTTAIEQNPFTDMDWNRFSMAGSGPIYNEAVEAMLGWAWPNGIITGNTETTINPLGAITRAEVAVMLGRYDRNVLGITEPTITAQPNTESSSDPSNTYEGYTLANGKPLTDENIQNILYGLKEEYPDFMRWTNEQSYYSQALRRTGYGCAGFALICSDAVFGSLPVSKIYADFDSIRVGDILRVDGNTHSVVVLEKRDNSVIVTEGNYGNIIYWGREISHNTLEGNMIGTTRYPA